MARQQGFVLVELMLAALLATLMMVWASQAVLNRINDANAEAVARWMQTVHHAVQAYLDRYGPRLRQASTAGHLAAYGYMDWSGPSLEELKQDGLLQSGFPLGIRRIGGVDVRVLREGDCPGQNCRLDTVIYSQQPFTRVSGAVDEQMVARWLLASSAMGGAVHSGRPTLLQGAVFTYPNPLPGLPPLPPGTVALAITHEQLMATDYLRVRDTRDPDFQNQLTVQGDITTRGALAVDGYLQLEASGRWLSSCDKEGAVTRDAVTGLLVCTYGSWESVSRSPGAYSVNSVHGCASPEGLPTFNPVTGFCSCPSGHTSVQVSEGTSGGPERGITRGFVCVN